MSTIYPRKTSSTHTKLVVPTRNFDSYPRETYFSWTVSQTVALGSRGALSERLSMRNKFRVGNCRSFAWVLLVLRG